MTTLGAPLPEVDIYITRVAPLSYVIYWYNNEQLTDPALGINGDTFKLQIGKPGQLVREYTAVCSSNSTTFAIDDIGSDVPFTLYDGVIVHVVNGEDVPVVNLVVHLQPN